MENQIISREEHPALDLKATKTNEEEKAESCMDHDSSCSSDTECERGSRAPPIPSFFLRSVPVYEEQDPFQHYDFTSVAGRGGYATVYIVQHLDSGKQYACKVVHTRDSEHYVERALKEAAMQSILSDHPNVTKIKEVWRTGLSHVFLMMEKCDGGEIFDAIVSRGALPEKDAATITRVILQLIHFCHLKGIIHHDLKPENFMLQDKEKGLQPGNVKAIDFGCTAYHDEPTRKLSGTPLYAAPEIIKGPHHDHRSDLWSAGIFLFCMLTGLMPFEGENNVDVKQAVLHQPIDFEEDPWPFVADEAKDLCKRLLQREPNDRILLEDALSHPWLKEHCLDEHVDFEDQSGILSNMQHFSSKSQLQRFLLLLQTHRPDTKPGNPISGLFGWMDRTGDRTLSFSEFKRGLLDIDSALSEAEIKDVFENVSQLNTGIVTFEEFQAASQNLLFLRNVSLDRLLNESLSDSALAHKSASVRLGSLLDSLPNPGEEFSKKICELRDSTDTDGYPCISRQRLQAAWDNATHHESTASRSGSSSDRAVDIEIQRLWQRKPSLDYRRSSLAGSSPLRGGSPGTESSWDRMALVRGGSPATIGYAGSEHGIGGSPRGASSLTYDSNQIGNEGCECRNREIFSSGGVIYWDGSDNNTHWEEEDEESDSLFGPALSAVQTRH